MIVWTFFAGSVFVAIYAVVFEPLVTGAVTRSIRGPDGAWRPMRVERGVSRELFWETYLRGVVPFVGFILLALVLVLNA